MNKAAGMFMTIFFALMIIPCIGVGWLGKNLLDRLGRYPSKTPALQMGIMFKLVVLEVVSVTLILMFFKALVSD